MAEPFPLLDRLAGLETEYAIRYRPDDTVPPLTRLQLYRAIIDALRRQWITVEAKHFKEGVFLATGGAVWFEAERPAAGGGLVEGSTPECRGPRQLLAYGRAQDRLLSQAARLAEVPGSLALVKNDRDAEGNVYGAQENYEATIAEGWHLVAWRAGLILLLPLALLTWVFMVVLIAAILIYLAAAGLLYLPLHFFVKDSKRLAQLLFGRDLAEGRETGGSVPVWMESLLLFLTRVITAPLAVPLLVHCWLFAFRTTRSQLLPFLISRTVFAGSGTIDPQDRLLLADKAPAINAVLGYGGFIGDRPVFNVGHLFKTICAESWFSIRAYLDLFGRRQRLQIGLGDSNLCEPAEYLRIGTTMLVLDLLESGSATRFPHLKRPLRTLHALCRDRSMRTEFEFSNGTRCTALDVQRAYCEACCRMVQRSQQASVEAEQILDWWQTILDLLEDYRDQRRTAQDLAGLVDWCTKQYLLEQGGDQLSREARKKVDLRYHELSPDGYYERLKNAGNVAQILEESEIERAMRNPPPDSPATVRGHYIREFSRDSGHLSVNWKLVSFGSGLRTRTIHLSRYGRRRSSGSPPPPDSDTSWADQLDPSEE